jgi:RHS repeat-associated protein
VTTYERDEKARVIEMVEASGTELARTTSITWDPDFNLPTQIVRPGLTTDFVYDTKGHLASKRQTDTTTNTEPYSTNGQTRAWDHTWSSTGQLLTVDGPLVTDQTIYTYRLDGYLETITNGLGHRITVDTVNSRGQPTRVIDANGTPIDLAYDGLGRLMSATVDPGPNQAVTSFGYNAIDQITRVTRPNDVVLNYKYNPAGRLTSITNDANEEIKLAYDKAGDSTKIDVKSSDGAIVVQMRGIYDELGRILKHIRAANQETQFAYDKVGHLIHITDPRSQDYDYLVDELNRPVRETGPRDHEINVTFTDRDDVESVTDARTNATVYVRNGRGDLIRERSADRGVTDYVYNELGLMTQRTDARGVIADFAYDVLGRMTSRSFPGAPSETTTWSYDSTADGNKGVGRLTGTTDRSGTEDYTYDALGRMTRVVRVIGARTYETVYAYDQDGNVTRITLPSGRTVTFARDSLARVTGVTTEDDAGAPSNTVVSSVAWRPFGPLASLIFGNGIGLALAYDNDGRVIDIDAAGGGIIVQDLTYTYDPASNITAIGDNLTTSRSQTFAYDDRDRLASATGPYGIKTYLYDAVGNRTEQTVTLPPAGTETYTTALTSNRLDSIAGTVTRSLTYAASGQVETDQRSPVDSWTYTIDQEGRMSAATLNGVPQATFAYNADGHRIVKTNALTGAETNYIYDLDGQLLAEMDGATGAPIREYIRLDDGLPIAYVDRQGPGGASRLFFYHNDQMGRPQKITDSSGNIVLDEVSDPFGKLHSTSGSIENVLRFPGQIYDPETGLMQNWHRDYDPSIGRYLQSDPAGLASGINTYAYVDGNPVSRIDPTGMQPTVGNWPKGPAPWPVTPSGTVHIGVTGGFTTLIGGSGSIGLSHDVHCATCYWDYARNLDVYGSLSGEAGYGAGASSGIVVGYWRDSAFLGTAQGPKFDFPLPGGLVISVAIGVDPSARSFQKICTGGQVSIGPGLEAGVVYYRSYTHVLFQILP